MDIKLNGEPFRLTTKETSLADLIAQIEVGASRFAVELNEEIVPKSLLSQTPLKVGDRVEIIVAVGGG